MKILELIGKIFSVLIISITLCFLVYTGGLITIYTGQFIYLLIIIFIILVIIIGKIIIKNNNIVPTQLENSQTTNLMSTLSEIDISDISSVIFIPINGQVFTIKTSNIKRLAVYITTKMKKTIFEHEELREIFDYVVLNLSSNVSNTDFNLIESKISEFVKSGGEIKIEKV